MKNYIAPLAALLGVALGAGMHHLSARNLEHERMSFEIRMNAYHDFLTGQAEVDRWEKELNKINPAEAEVKKYYEDKIAMAKIKIRDSMLRIAVFSEKSVAMSVAEWLSPRRASIPCPKGGSPERESFLLDLAMYRAMRNEAFKGDKNQIISKQPMALLVYGCNLDSEP
jgi:hypothetical protein